MTPLIALTFETLTDVLRDPIVVSTLLAENLRDDRVHKDCPILICRKTMCTNISELPINDFDIIFCMDWLINFMPSLIAVVGL